MNLKSVTCLALLALACGKGASSGNGDTASAQPDTGTAAAVPDSAPGQPNAQDMPVDSSKPIIQRPIPLDSEPGVTVGATATVAGILQTPSLTGKQVRVTGTCLGYRVPPVAIGSPPRTRSDWQLESAAQAIYVTGPLPAGCDAAAGSTGLVTIVATVREDTLPSLGGNDGAARRYLEWKGP